MLGTPEFEIVPVHSLWGCCFPFKSLSLSLSLSQRAFYVLLWAPLSPAASAALKKIYGAMIAPL